jgi:hypothetical protein
MINPNIVGIPLPDSATRVPVTGGGQSGSAAQSNAFTEVMTSSEVYQEGCHGTMNEVNLDDFFAAWGSNDSAYDIDNSGTVDGLDLSMFLGMGQPAGPPAPGSAADIQSQWGTVGHSTGDLNGDYIVDGLDLALSLGDSPSVGDITLNQPAEQSESPLQSILDNWGSADESSDLDADGTTSGSDLAMLLSGLSGLSQSEVEPMDVSPVSQQVFDILNEMGFAEQAPVNINQVIDGLRLGTFESKTVTMDLLELYGNSSKSDAREARVSRR